jgi:hypothetical protein
MWVALLHLVMRLLVLTLPLVAVACLDAPSFTVGKSAAEGSGDLHDGMVLVPGAVEDGEVTPTDKSPPDAGKNDAGKGGDGPGDGKGKGGGDSKPDAGAPSGGGSSSGGSSSGGSSSSSGGTPSTPPAPSSGSVTVAAFWIDAHEVSAHDYAACVATGACTAASCASDGDDHPVVCVTVDQANDYCAFAKKRLPTSAEWTAAAAGPSRRQYPWGSDTPASDRLNACGGECGGTHMYAASDGFARTAPGGSFVLGVTPDGVYDLAGNVAEWVDAPSPTVRGGSWQDGDPAAVTSTAAHAQAAADPTVGFRCAVDD